jgi:glycosyltransferase involved in cell wall biosynthesis
MKITFVMPCYPWTPMGGFRVVYEYANQLVNFGHHVSVVHPRDVRFGPRPNLSLYEKLRDWKNGLASRDRTPVIKWQKIDPRIVLTFAPDTHPTHIPEGDAIFATSWKTVASVLDYPLSKGKKFYLIQGYEACMGPKDLVDQTWRAPLQKIVVSQWLFDLGKTLGATNVAYIPNAIDHERYKIAVPPEERSKRVGMLFSHEPFKGSRDGIAAIEIAKKRHPDLTAVLFGTGRQAKWIPNWIQYHRNPDQEYIVSEIYNRSSVFLSASWAEGFALPPAEAACCGCAVVATNSGGIADFIEDGRTGLLSAPKDPATLGKNLCHLLDDDALRLRLAEAARQRLSAFTWKRSAEMLESVIETSRKLSPDLQTV